MRQKRSSRISFVGALVLSAMLATSAPVSAIPVLKYRCTGTVTYQGQLFQYNNHDAWDWNFVSYGSCFLGVLQKVTYVVQGFTAAQTPLYTTPQPSPGIRYLAFTTITHPTQGWTTTIAQRWETDGNVFQINAWDPQGNPEGDPNYWFGGITGCGLVSRQTKGGGTWENPTFTGKVVFSFGDDELPDIFIPEQDTVSCVGFNPDTHDL